MDNARKIMIIRKDPMDKISQRHWSPHLRKKLHPFVYRNLGVHYCPYYAFYTRHKFAEWIRQNYGYGYFHVFIWREGYYKKRSVKRLRPYRIGTIEIIEGKVVNFIDLGRISRFKWFEPVRKSIRFQGGDE